MRGNTSLRAVFIAALTFGAAVLVPGIASASSSQSDTSSTTTALTSPTPVPSSTYVNGDSNAFVNEYPNGLWTTSTLASAHDADAVAASPDATDGYGCPDGVACGWVEENYELQMGQWAETNAWFGSFSQSECSGSYAAPDADGTWNDCVSAMDDDKNCTFYWFWNINYGGQEWAEGSHVAHGTIGSSNNEFSSDEAIC